MVRKKDTWRQNHETLKKELWKAELDGVTKSELYKRSGLSRPTIDKHLEKFIEKGAVKREGRRYFWASTRGLFKSVRDLQQHMDAAFHVLITKKVMKILDEGRHYITSDEINQVFEEVRREVTRPKVGDLYSEKKKGKKG